MEDDDQERYLAELAADVTLHRVDGISALHVTPPDQALMQAEEDDEDALALVRQETFNVLLHWLIEEGPQPAMIARRFFLLCKVRAPEILRKHGVESFEAQGQILGVRRATVCAAFKREITAKVETAERRNGHNHGSFKASFQKTSTNVEKLSAAQRRSQSQNGANRSKKKRSRS